MKQEVEIEIYSTQVIESEKSEVKLKAAGHFYEKGGQYYLSYQETEDTGYEGCRSVLKLTNDDLVSLTRFGAAHSQLLIERGQSNRCPYNTGYGILDLEVLGHEIKWTIEETAGHLFMSYTLNLGADTSSYNEIEIRWQEAPAQQE